jgi:hypothetical protein
MVAPRNSAIGPLRLRGERNIAAATRRLAAQPRTALALIGITHDYQMALPSGIRVLSDPVWTYNIGSFRYSIVDSRI